MLTFVTSIDVPVPGDVNLLGALPGPGTIYLESYDTTNEHYAQVALTWDGTLLARGDDRSPLTPPPGIIRPRSAWATMELNFAGSRHRGLRGAERIDELAHPMPMPERLWLSTYLGLGIPPPMILGWIESYSLAEAEISRGLFCVCRRLRAAYTLTEKRSLEDGQQIDYDSASLYIAHLFRPGKQEDLPIAELAQQLPGADLRRPMDCMTIGEHLLVADGGDNQHPARLHRWLMERDDTHTRQRQKLYG